MDDIYWKITEVRKLKQMRKDGYKVKDIALALGKTYSSVSSYISFLGIGIHKKMSDEQKGRTGY
jgi:predicted transcriptional regulator